MNQLIDAYKEIEYHKNINVRQKKAFKSDIMNADLLKNAIVIEMDFKMKIPLGTAPREVNTEFYERKMRSFFGVGVYYLNRQNEIKLLNIDVVTEESNNAATVVNCLQFIRNQFFYQKHNALNELEDEKIIFEKQQIIFWCDTGK